MKKETERFTSSSVFEGMVSIRAVLNAPERFNDRRIREIIYEEERQCKLRDDLAYLRKEADRKSFSIRRAEPGEIEYKTVGNSHGGIIAVCGDRTIRPLDQDALEDNRFIVCLDGIEDPYNFGYALRSVYAAGATSVILSPRNWMSAAGVVCRSSAGASELLPMYLCHDDMINLLRRNHYSVVCAGIRNSVSCWEASLKLPLVLIVGGEKRGISRAVMDRSDLIVRLDYGRPFRGSLSAASAASVLAFEVLRQNTEELGFGTEHGRQ